MEQRCTLCPRTCPADRGKGELGFCKSPLVFSIARASLHMWEEPSISGTRGSGTVFFTGCNLRCLYCQNREISRGDGGKLLNDEEFTALLYRLRDAGAHNINLVTPTPYAARLGELLKKIKPTLGIPVVFNCGGYESVETLQMLEGCVDIYLPDLKYFDAELSARYSSAPDYFPRAMDAIDEMLRQTGDPVTDTDGILQRGTVVRHLVLPSHRKDSIEILRRLAERFGTKEILLSLMSQYTPTFAADCPHPNLHRRVTSFEYESVLAEAERLGFHGYLQDRTSATAEYTPNFQESSFL